MANTIAVSQTHPITPKHAHIGLVNITIVSTETYTTASGGFTADLSTILAALGIDFDDIILVQGAPTVTGHMPVVTKTATAGQVTIRLWNGSTEIANGALTQTLTLAVFYSQGARP